MKNQFYGLATYRHAGQEKTGLVLGGQLVEVNQALGAQTSNSGQPSDEIGTDSSMLSILHKWPRYADRLAAAVKYYSSHPEAIGKIDSVDIADVTLLPPVPNPGKIINVGLNFYDHAREMGFANLPEDFQPNFFPKGDGSTVVGPGQSIRLSSSFVDWEAELAVIIGKRACCVSVDDAMDYVAGYTCHNDVTDRGLMMKPDGSLDFFAGKYRDTFAPLGPIFVPRELMPDLREIRIRCYLNGEVMQDFGMDQIIWGPAQCIAFISGIVTLVPGDVIGLGTGAGTGWAKGITIGPGEMPKLIENMFQGGGRLLRAGDRVVVEIEPIGLLENGVERYEQ